MRTIVDPANALGRGLSAIRAEYQVPEGFPADVIAEAERVAGKNPGPRADRTGWNFVTPDPASATDLDQAFAIDGEGDDFLLHYAIADIGWFVADAPAVDAEAWQRGTTLYLPDGKARAIKRTLGKLGVPKGAVVGAIIRGAQVIVPRGNTQVLEGDRVVVFALPDAIEEVQRIFT